MTSADLVLPDVPVATTAGLLADRPVWSDATLASSVNSDEIFRKVLTDGRFISDDNFTVSRRSGNDRHDPPADPLSNAAFWRGGRSVRAFAPPT
jgi:hypothetical protein